MDANEFRKLLKDQIETTGIASVLEQLHDATEELANPYGTPIEQACYYVVSQLEDAQNDAANYEAENG